MNRSPNRLAKYKCVIIDDDPFIRDLLSDKLTEYFPEIAIAAIASDGSEGVQILNVLKPDLVFLDVEMIDMTGFEVLTKLPEIEFKTIFITSYRHYAIKAIRFNALDYLLKPFDLEEMKIAISRFKDQIRQNYHQDIKGHALANLAAPEVADEILALNTQEGQLRIAVKDILHIQGDRNYSCIFHHKEDKEIVSKTLSDLEQILNDRYFFRCHKSHLVNKSHIQSVNSCTTSLTLFSGLELPISRRKRQQFLAWYEGYQTL